MYSYILLILFYFILFYNILYLISCSYDIINHNHHFSGIQFDINKSLN